MLEASDLQLQEREHMAGQKILKKYLRVTADCKLNMNLLNRKMPYGNVHAEEWVGVLCSAPVCSAQDRSVLKYPFSVLGIIIQRTTGITEDYSNYSYKDKQNLRK